MSHIARVIFFLAMLLPSTSFSETKETEHLGRITEQYGKCADVAVGNFDSDKETQFAGRLFFKAMIKNIRSMIEIEQRQGHEPTIMFIDIMGKDVFTGYMLRAFSDVNEAYKAEKKSLQRTNNWDWKRTNQQLWEKYGCDAIYKGLPQ